VEQACDFRTLKYEKDAILVRLNEENVKHNTDMDVLLKVELQADVETRMIRDIFDRLSGMQLMVERLKADFGMSDDEIKKQGGFRELNLIQKAKLAMKMQMFKKTR
jgi:hypothetical protein